MYNESEHWTNDWYQSKSVPSLPTYNVFTDGACLGNPGSGGWAAVIRSKSDPSLPRQVLNGGFETTTNNRMEIMPVIKALEALNEPSKVDLYTDSQYVSKGINEWIDGWIGRGWRSSSGKPVKNKDLWLRLVPLLEKHRVTAHWVEGHSGNPDNEDCDFLARESAKRYDLPIDTGYEG